MRSPTVCLVPKASGSCCLRTSLARLSDHLGQYGEHLRGQIVLTGSPLPLYRVAAGERSATHKPQERARQTNVVSLDFVPASAGVRKDGFTPGGVRTLGEHRLRNLSRQWNSRWIAS